MCLSFFLVKCLGKGIDLFRMQIVFRILKNVNWKLPTTAKWKNMCGISDCE